MISLPQDQLEELKKVYGIVATAEEGGCAYVRISNLKLPEGCDPNHATALLCPGPRDGYTSRLFFNQAIKHRGKGTNWNAQGVCILGENWWAVSWRISPENKTLLSMVLGHLEAVSN